MTTSPGRGTSVEPAVIESPWQARTSRYGKSHVSAEPNEMFLNIKMLRNNHGLLATTEKKPSGKSSTSSGCIRRNLEHIGRS
jgi:hypothetical protein